MFKNEVQIGNEQSQQTSSQRSSEMLFRAAQESVEELNRQLIDMEVERRKQHKVKPEIIVDVKTQSSSRAGRRAKTTGIGATVARQRTGRSENHSRGAHHQGRVLDAAT